MKINGPLAKDITRQIVCELYSDFVENRKEATVLSLPGEVWKFEEHVLLTHYSKNLENTELICFENDKNKIIHNAQKGNKRLRNFVHRQHNFFPLSCLDDYFILDQAHRKNGINLGYYEDFISTDYDIMYDSFCWFDYCGNPSKDRLDNLVICDDNSPYSFYSVDVFTFSTGWRREDNILPSILEDSKTIGPAKAILKYFQDKIANTSFKIVFDIEYVSNHTPMIIIAITNDPNILNNLKWQKYNEKPILIKRKTKTKAEKKVKNDYTLVYEDLRNKVDEKIIIEKHKINKHQLGACKAWVTMRNQ